MVFASRLDNSRCETDMGGSSIFLEVDVSVSVVFAATAQCDRAQLRPAPATQ